MTCPTWSNGGQFEVGAVTWGNGSTGTSGPVGIANSLIGSQDKDRVGYDGVKALANGNYVVCSSKWSNGPIAEAGAATWGNGSTGVKGVVSAANSLVGSSDYDGVAIGGVTALTNGNFVVASYYWNNGAVSRAGAATWCNGTTGRVGPVTTTNSLVGTTTEDLLGNSVALANGNYVVIAPNWDNGSIVDAGSATWGNGSTGITGTVSAANSLVGATAQDQIGNEGCAVLTNGNYVIGSPGWDNGSLEDVGAATWGNGSTGITGTVSITNSLVGSVASEGLGGSLTPLTNGNYVVASFGKVTWANGSTGITGKVSDASGLSSNGEMDVFALTNGNYVVRSQIWDGAAGKEIGAITWGNGATGTSGTVSTSNSLVTPANTTDAISNCFALTNGNFLVNTTSYKFSPDEPLVFWGNGSAASAGQLFDDQARHRGGFDPAVCEPINNLFFASTKIGSQENGFRRSPSIASVTPASGTMLGGTQIKITGTNFPAKNFRVFIGWQDVTNLQVLSPTTITCVTPPGGWGPAVISAIVDVDGVGDSNETVFFTYTTPPEVSVTPVVGPVQPLATFLPGSDAYDASGDLVLGPDGAFYGGTFSGGTSGNGTIFKVTANGQRTTLVDFTGTGGAFPGRTFAQGMMMGSDGAFYGMTERGGASDKGTIFKLTASGQFTSLVQFTGTTGADPGSLPVGRLVQGNDGAFYGSTSEGGAADVGTIFKMTAAGVRTTLVEFAASGPRTPQRLTKGKDGNFYGTTWLGGAGDWGTAFKITPAGIRTTLVEFTGPSGDRPGTYPSSLVLGSDGLLYGTATDANSARYPFSLKTDGTYKALTPFDWNGIPMVQGIDGAFFGVASTGSAFRWTTDGTYTSLAGIGIGLGSMTQGPDGVLYGISTLPSDYTVTRVYRLPVFDPVTALTPTSARLGGNVTDDGGTSITDRGVVYARTSANAAPVIGGSGVVQVAANGTLGFFTVPVVALLPNTGYSMRAYAVNEAGITYSDVQTFTTLPTLQKLAVTDASDVSIEDGATLDFADAGIGATKTRTVTIRNKGNVALSNISVAVSGIDALKFTLSALSATTLSPGASMTVTISFKPTDTSSSTATFKITSSDLPVTLKLTGKGATATPATIAVLQLGNTTPITSNGPALNLGSIVLGTEVTNTFTIRNNGTLNLTGLALTTTGTNAADMIISPLTTTALGAGDATSFTATLRPGALGVRNGTIRIASNDTTKQPYFLINLTGTGTSPEIDIKDGATALTDGKSSVSFGTTVPVETPVEKTFTIANTGTANLTLGSVLVDGANAAEFVAGTPVSTTLTPGSSTTLKVTFTPTTAGARTAALHLLSNDGTESPFDITLTGTAKGPEISVQQPVNVQLTSNTSTIDFGQVMNGSSSTRTFTIKNLGSATLNLTSVTSNTAQFIIASTPRFAPTLAANASTTFAVTFTPGAVASFTGEIAIASNDVNEATFRVTVNGQGVAPTAPTIDPGPQSQIIALGQPVTFDATVTTPLTFTRQWSKGTTAFANITGATSATYNIPSVKLTDAAVLYRLRATNTIGSLFTDSMPAALTVVDPKTSSASVAIKKSVSFTISAASSGTLTYLWKKDNVAITPSARVVGSNTNKLTINNLALTDAGTYTCAVSGPGGTMTGGANVLSVFDSAPVITPSPLSLPDAIVGGDYSFTIPLDPNEGSATSFSSGSLPTGLALNATTGVISGKPTLALTAPTDYTFTVTAKNASGTGSASAKIKIYPMPANTAGAYVGIIERGPISGGLGGRIDLNVAPTGNYTGTIKLGANASITLPPGVIIATNGKTDVSSSITVTRSGLPPIIINLIIDTTTNRFAPNGCRVSVGNDSSDVTGWRNVWNSTVQSTNHKGIYNFALDVSETSVAIPQGLGYGSFTVPLKGETFATAGKLADEEAYTQNTFLGPEGEIAVFAELPRKGSLIGKLQVQLGTAPTYADSTLSAGTLTWSLPASAVTTESTYKAGFDPIKLTAEGGRYVAPVSPAIVMGKVAGANNAKIGFFDAGIGGLPSRADRSLTLTAGATVTNSAAGTTKTACTITTATGLFTGTFTLVDNHPFLSGAPVITRNVAYQGILIPTLNGVQGRGFFLLQQLPTNVFPAPAVLPMLSGGVVIE